MKSLKLFIHAFRDLAIRYLPKTTQKSGFAFIVHPRNIPDVYRKYPFLKFLPKSGLEWFLSHFWPVILSEVEGFKNSKGEPVRGWIITIPLTAEQMLKNRELAEKKILQAIKLAEKLGVKMTGLGAFTSSVTGGGQSLVGKADTFITNGNSLTAATTISDIEKIVSADKSKKILAVVGATGSIGSAVAKILAKRKIFNDLILVGKTPENLAKLKESIRKIDNSSNIFITSDIAEIKKADIVVVATSAKDAIVHSEHLKQGVILYDITQPKNTSSEMLEERTDIKFIDGGLIKTPGINYHFNFGIPLETAFSCLAETMILTGEGVEKDYSLGHVEAERVEEISELIKKYNFSSHDSP